MSRLYVGLPPTKTAAATHRAATRTTDFSRRDHVSQSSTWSCASIKRPGSHVRNCTLKYKYIPVVVLFLCCVEEIRKREAATSRYTPTRSTETRANSPSDSESNSTQAFGDGDCSLKRWDAGSWNRSRCHDAVIFVCTHETSHVGTNMAHRVLNSSTRKCTPYHTKARRGKRLNYGSRLGVGLLPTKLLLRLTEQLLHV